MTWWTTTSAATSGRRSPRIPASVSQPLGQSVAKVICLLQFVQAVHRTPENIAAALYPALGADSQLTAVALALEELERRQSDPPGRRRLPHPHADGG